MNNEDEVAAGWPDPQLSTANGLVLGQGCSFPHSSVVAHSQRTSHRADEKEASVPGGCKSAPTCGGG